MRYLNIKQVLFIFVLCVSAPAFSQSAAQIADFTKAAKFDDVSEVKNLIAKGVSPNTVDPTGDPMLVIAIRDKSIKVSEFLLKNKSIDVDLSNKYGETPLMIASINGDLPLVKVLVLEYKARVDHIAWTPLHYACAKGHLEVAEFLVANGALVDSTSLNGTTPLMMAVQSGNEELIKFLLDKGADLRLRNTNGLSAIDIAVIYEKPWIATALKSRWQKLYKQPYPGYQRAIPAKSS
jgi:ankyrin repeat protein